MIKEALTDGFINNLILQLPILKEWYFGPCPEFYILYFVPDPCPVACVTIYKKKKSVVGLGHHHPTKKLKQEMIRRKTNMSLVILRSGQEGKVRSIRIQDSPGPSCKLKTPP